MTLNPEAVSKTYRDEPVVIDHRSSLLFALALGETRAAYIDPRSPGGILVPPVYAAVYAHGPIARVLSDPSVGVHYPSIVHYAQTFEWLAPVRPGDRIQTTARIRQAESFESGGILAVETTSVREDGDAVTRGIWTFFDKQSKARGAGRPPRPAALDGVTVWRSTVAVPPYQTYLYAAASGDHNAIHVDEAEARTRGLDGMIVHGFCTMGLCAAVVVDRLCKGDPARLRSLSLRFARPIYPGTALELEGFRVAPQRFGLRMLDKTGASVLRDVECRLTI